MTYARLILTPPAGPRQEFTLAKAAVSIGRSSANDIALADTNASRFHTRLEAGEQGCAIVDLGSVNGTRVNGVRVERAALAPGDLITIGKSTLRFEAAGAEADLEMTRLETQQDVETSLLETPLEMQLEETGSPRLAVCLREKTWEVPLTAEALTIGRHPDCEVFIESPKVSRRHARVERSGEGFLLRDLGSDNGTWLGTRRLTEHYLQPGETVRIGPARLVFKGPVSTEGLTLVEEPSPGWQRRPVVIVPGLGGSCLWRGNERVWPNVRLLFSSLDLFRLGEGGGPPLEPRGLVDEVVIVPNLIKLEQYGRLTEYLEENLGYERGKDLMEFAYDFRQDVRLAARQLGAAIDAWNVKPPVTLIAHSLGCLVSRYYVERLGGHNKVGRLLLMGGPHSGVPKAFSILMVGPRLLPFGLLDDQLRRTMATFPSTYQILPTYTCVSDQADRPVDVLADETWLPAEYRWMLRNAREFRTELGVHSSVPTVCIFGYGIKTVAQIAIERDPQGLPRKADVKIEPNGDAAIPDCSTVMEGVEIHPVHQYHGTLYVDGDVKMRLKLELTRRDA
jgi:pSer/pThr/pTyr-binding forkhead associated (FHA) protein